MSFGYPSFLWALLALSLPLIIHLFNFRKTTRIYFSTTRFLKQVKEETTKKRKLKQYLILASRLLFLFFLVIAFAQPFRPAKEQVTDQRTIVIYLDNSLSMASPTDDKTRALDEAIRMAQAIVDLFPAETQYQLLTNDFAPFSNSFKTKAAISDLLAQIKLSSVSRSAQEINNRVKEKLATLFWLSDFQKSTFGNEEKIDSTLQVKLVPIGLERNANVFIDSVYLENIFAIAGEKNILTVRLRNSGKKEVEGLVTKLSINGAQAAVTSVNIGPESFTTVPFDIVSGLKERNKAVISFTDFPISFDNEFFFTLNYTSRINVVEIKSDAPSPYISSVYGNKKIFSFRSFTAVNLNYSLLAAADLVVLNGIERIDNALAEALNAYTMNYGSLLLVPSAQPDIPSYQKIAPVSLSKAVSEEMTPLDKPDFQNPFFANVFEDRTSAIAMPQASRVLDWGADRSAILKFKNDQPFLSHFQKLFLMASPLEKKFTDFYNNALFVPVMYRLAASGKKAGSPLYYSITTSTIILPADSLIGEEPAKLAGNQEFVPSQRKSNGQLFMELPKYALSAGFYYVTNKSDTLGLIALDLDKNESLLTQLTPTEAKSALGGKNNISIFNVSSSDAFRSEIKERYLGKPLWKYAILLALTFLLAEVLLIRFLK